mmetsp:Transcript_72062/g.234210  ORF Transcript_72062/g.234210 Transcript_72062/m.234210 type:complete len:222 (-) Transcript_72062:189-854(-)
MSVSISINPKRSGSRTPAKCCATRSMPVTQAEGTPLDRVSRVVPFAGMACWSQTMAISSCDFEHVQQSAHAGGQQVGVLLGAAQDASESRVDDRCASVRPRFDNGCSWPHHLSKAHIHPTRSAHPRRQVRPVYNVGYVNITATITPWLGSAHHGQFTQVIVTTDWKLVNRSQAIPQQLQPLIHLGSPRIGNGTQLLHAQRFQKRRCRSCLVALLVAAEVIA